MKRLLSILILTFVVVTGVSNNINAQCSMCRASATSNMNNKQANAQKNNVGAGLNTGILYLLSIPYILGGLGVLIYFRNKKQIKAMFSSE